MKYNLVVAGGGLSGVAAAVSAPVRVSRFYLLKNQVALVVQLPTILFIPLCPIGLNLTGRKMLQETTFHKAFSRK